jgi:hypothetical protein
LLSRTTDAKKKKTLALYLKKGVNVPLAAKKNRHRHMDGEDFGEDDCTRANRVLWYPFVQGALKEAG